MIEWNSPLHPFRQWLAVAAIAIVALSSIDTEAKEPASSSTEVSGYEADFPAMGTLVSLKIFSSDRLLVERAVLASELRAREIESILTDYDSESEAARLTEIAAGKEFVPVSADLWKVIEASDRWNTISSGAFDASLGTLSQLWRAQRRTKQTPAIERIEAARQASGWKHVQVERESKRLRFDREGIRLDFGAIGKGFVVDEIFDLLQTMGIKSCLVNISGNMRCGDPPPDRTGWRIAIAPLQQHEPPLRYLLLRNSAIATSGDLWQFITLEGKRYSHILDPRSGASVAGPIAATVVAPTAMDADACATAICVLGPTLGAQMVSGLPGLKALILEQSDPSLPIRYVATPGFDRD
jgi:FAD:protein FMN transferase